MRTNRGITALTALIALIAVPASSQEALSWVPADSAIVGMVDVEDWRGSEATKRIFEKTSDVTMDGELEAFLSETGLDPREDIDTVVVAVRPQGSIAVAPLKQTLVLAEGKFDRTRLNAAVAKLSDELEIRSIDGQSYFVGTDADEGEDVSFAIAFMSDSLVMAGSTDLVEASLRGETRRGFLAASPLGRELGRLSDDVNAWILADVPRAGRLGTDVAEELGEGAKLTSMLRYVSTVAFWATERDGNLALGGLAVSTDQETLELLDDTLRGMTAAWRLAVRDQNPDWIPVARSFQVDHDRDSVWITGEIPVDFLADQHAKIASQHD